MFARTVIIIQLLLAVLIINGQPTDQDSCGIDKNPILNKCEAMFFDSLYTTILSLKKGFNFLNKKMAFFDATKQITKEQYFTLIKGYRGPKGVDILSDKQKKRQALM